MLCLDSLDSLQLGTVRGKLLDSLDSLPSNCQVHVVGFVGFASLELSGACCWIRWIRFLGTGRGKLLDSLDSLIGTVTGVLGTVRQNWNTGS